MEIDKSVLITGASSGIGAALAIAYAKPRTFLALSGRDAERLQKIAIKCEGHGAKVETKIIDVTERVAVSNWISDISGRMPLDLVIANAGIAGGADGAGQGSEAAYKIFETNINGVLHTVLPALEFMEKRGSGQVAIMSSLASFRGFAGTPAYAASKAAVRIWGEGLRGRYAPKGVKVSVICPGFVESRMTANNPFPMPLMMSGKRAAKIIQRGLEKNAARIAFPWRMYFLAWLFGSLPPSISDRLMPKVAEKE
ncbi:MAG: short-chain dehydrogenase [Rhodospirillaceae bacterium]|nr:short-chain dehydrogenase [Rhodospirillaceae bacterium]|tara:strand:+ start:5181 stop:5942 length:762 start_codon:yes stop_codon:yes gene_type:complete